MLRGDIVPIYFLLIKVNDTVPFILIHVTARYRQQKQKLQTLHAFIAFRASSMLYCLVGHACKDIK